MLPMPRSAEPRLTVYVTGADMLPAQSTAMSACMPLLLRAAGLVVSMVTALGLVNASDAGFTVGAAAHAATVCVPQVAKPEMVSAQVNFAVTVCPNVKLVPETENFAVNVGAVLSIGVGYGPTEFDMLPARSVIVWGRICAAEPVPVVLGVSVAVREPCKTPFVFGITLGVIGVPVLNPEPTSVA